MTSVEKRFIRLMFPGEQSVLLEKASMADEKPPVLEDCPRKIFGHRLHINIVFPSSENISVYLPGPERPSAPSASFIVVTRKWAARCCTGDDP